MNIKCFHPYDKNDFEALFDKDENSEQMTLDYSMESVFICKDTESIIKLYNS
jgi:hypothetical protein